MGLSSIVKSKGYKQFMSKVYGWGASVVILGALFKIQHYPGAGIMLICGLSVEAIIFFFSAFEPPHVEPDWSLVYPELAGMYHDDKDLQNMGLLPNGTKDKKTVTEELDNMLEKAKIGPELIESLGAGLRKLSENTTKLSDVSNASVATEEYVNNIKNAAKSAGDLTRSYVKTAEVLSEDVNASQELAKILKNTSKSASELSDSYTKAATNLKSELNANDEYVKSVKAASEAINKLNTSYIQSAEQLSKTAHSLDFSGIDKNAINQKFQTISKNLEALNSVYELQLKSVTDQTQISNKLQQEMNKFAGFLNESIDNTAKYKDQAALLTQSISALNNVYGNMLAAMNINPKK
ncbi:MAG: gliding motility protein GldL [Bacteroidales bacterium]|nr:gliding motility protein GldL [Bacteroidales bacterium]